MEPWVSGNIRYEPIEFWYLLFPWDDPPVPADLCCMEMTNLSSPHRAKLPQWIISPFHLIIVIIFSELSPTKQRAPFCLTHLASSPSLWWTEANRLWIWLPRIVFLRSSRGFSGLKWTLWAKLGSAEKCEDVCRELHCWLAVTLIPPAFPSLAPARWHKIKPLHIKRAVRNQIPRCVACCSPVTNARLVSLTQYVHHQCWFSCPDWVISGKMKTWTWVKCFQAAWL